MSFACNDVGSKMARQAQAEISFSPKGMAAVSGRNLRGDVGPSDYCKRSVRLKAESWSEGLRSNQFSGIEIRQNRAVTPLMRVLE